MAMIEIREIAGKIWECRFDAKASAEQISPGGDPMVVIYALDNGQAAGPEVMLSLEMMNRLAAGWVMERNLQHLCVPEKSHCPSSSWSYVAWCPECHKLASAVVDTPRHGRAVRVAVTDMMMDGMTVNRVSSESVRDMALCICPLPELSDD